MGKSTVNWPFSIATLNYQRVIHKPTGHSTTESEWYSQLNDPEFRAIMQHEFKGKLRLSVHPKVVAIAVYMDTLGVAKELFLPVHHHWTSLNTIKHHQTSWKPVLCYLASARDDTSLCQALARLTCHSAPKLAWQRPCFWFEIGQASQMAKIHKIQIIPNEYFREFQYVSMISFVGWPLLITSSCFGPCFDTSLCH